MAKIIKVSIMKEEEMEVPSFSEIDRTNLIIGVGEIYGRDGTYPRTDLGRWLFQVPGFAENVWLESNGKLHCSAESITCKTMISAVENEGKIIYQRLMREKYEPLFRKYNLKGFEEVKSLNTSQKGLKDWLISRWIPGEILTRSEEEGVQNGNLGMFVHRWESGVKDIKVYRYRITYYIDFPGKIFEPNIFGGTQSPEELAKWGKKIFTPKTYNFNTKKEREMSVKDSYERFKRGELLGFE